MNRLANLPKRYLPVVNNIRYYSGQLGDLGSGAGQGGGGGGSIREAGGSFGRMEAAREGEYFYKLQQKQMEQLKAGLTQEIQFHEQQIKEHQQALERHKKRVHELEDQ